MSIRQLDQTFLNTSIETLLTSPVPIQSTETSSCSQKPPKLKTEITIKSENNTKANTCRVCLQDGNIPIYGDEIHRNVSEDLNTFTGLNIQQDDEHPKHLCVACYSLLRSAMQLRMTAQYSDQILRDLARRARSASPVIIDKRWSESPDSFKQESPKSSPASNRSGYSSSDDEIPIKDLKRKEKTITAKSIPSKNANMWTDKAQIIKDLSLGKEIKIEHVVIKKSVTNPTDSTMKSPKVSLLKQPAVETVICEEIPSSKRTKVSLIKCKKDSGEVQSVMCEQIPSSKGTLVSLIKQPAVESVMCEEIPNSKRTKVSLIKQPAVETVICEEIPSSKRTKVSLIKRKNDTSGVESVTCGEQMLNSNRIKKSLKRSSLLKHKKGKDRPKRGLLADNKYKSVIIAESIIIPTENSPRISLLQNRKKPGDKEKHKSIRGDIINPLTSSCRISLLKPKKEEDEDQATKGDVKNKELNIIDPALAPQRISLLKHKQYMGAEDRAKLKVKRKRGTNCALCDIKFQSKEELEQHLESEEHKSHKNKKECPICHKHYGLQYFKTHLEFHNEDTSYICDICGKEFKTKLLCEGHRRRHNVKLTFKCSICPYRHYTRHAVKKHEKTHLQQKTAQCPECFKCFSNNSNMNTHLRRHKEPEFKCDMCNKGFYYKKFLQEHIRSDHLGIKDHICEICGKAFGFRKPMMKHMLKVHKRQKLRQGVIPLYLLPEHQIDVDTSEPEGAL